MTNQRGRVNIADIIRISLKGPRRRPARTALTTLGVAVAIASTVTVLGISTSSKADLLDQLDELGTNTLVIEPGQNLTGQTAAIPLTATAMINRIPAAQAVAATTTLDTETRAQDLTQPGRTNGIATIAADHNLAQTLNLTTVQGRFHDHATIGYPTIVLGATAAQRLNITTTNTRVWTNDQWFTVIGILEPLPLHPDIDRAAIIGYPIADTITGQTHTPETIYVRADPNHIEALQTVLAPTANPSQPNEIAVTRPSDALVAKTRVDATFTFLVIALTLIALTIGSIGIANVMIITVMERRTEIGLRRALGAQPAHIATQFLIESAGLATLGGIAGTIIGITTTHIYAQTQNWSTNLPTTHIAAAVLASTLAGTLAGLHPARQAAKLDPTTALQGA